MNGVIVWVIGEEVLEQEAPTKSWDSPQRLSPGVTHAMAGSLLWTVACE